MITRDLENTLTGRHITRAERISEGLRAARSLTDAGRVDDARRIMRALKAVGEDDPRIGALEAMIDETERRAGQA